MSAPRRTILIVLAAILGIVLAAAITWGTSQLVRQRIGLSSEPLTAGRRLLPKTPVGTSTQSTPAPARTSPTGSTSTTRSAPSTTTVPAQAPPPTPTAPQTPVSPPVESTPSRRGSGGDGGDSSSRRDD